MIYKYCTTDGFDILLKARLKVVRIENFNDPFELVFGVDEESAFDNIKKEYESNKNIINDWQYLLDDQKIEYDKNSIEDIIEKVTQFQIKDFKKSILSIRENWNEKMGVVCLSESPNIIQMWAHYADNHRGIVIALDENQFVKDRMALVKVCCRDEMVLLPVTATPEKLEQYDKYIDDVIRRKESNWRYEKEVRLYANLTEKDKDGYYYFDIPQSSITEIYLGLMSPETTEIIAKSIKQRKEYNHLRIYKMDRHESAFKLIPKEL
jgi:hypothetical protein